VDLILTDPPYGVDYVEKTRYLAQRGIGTGLSAISALTRARITAWFAKFLRVVPWAEYATCYGTGVAALSVARYARDLASAVGEDTPKRNCKDSTRPAMR
jgi:hypothetical protein